MEKARNIMRGTFNICLINNGTIRKRVLITKEGALEAGSVSTNGVELITGEVDVGIEDEGLI